MDISFTKDKRFKKHPENLITSICYTQDSTPLHTNLITLDFILQFDHHNSLILTIHNNIYTHIQKQFEA